MRRALLVAGLACALVGGLPAATAAPRTDFAAVALNVLPPGESGSLSFGAHATDQLRLYDGLTPLAGNVRPADLSRFFKPARFGLGGARPARVERTGRPGLELYRDGWDVAHVYGRTRDDVAFGAGWVTAEDRSLLLDLIRGPGRLAALDAPGYDAFSFALSGRQFASSPGTEAFLSSQISLVRGLGPSGARVLRDIDAYVAGINAYYKRTDQPIRPWTRNDVIASAALIGSVFGAGGGDEARRSQFLSALEQRLGAARGRAVFDDLREQRDPEAYVSVDRSFPYGLEPQGAGNAVVDADSLRGGLAGFRPGRSMSNALLVSAARSATGHPLFVAGPQVGYFYPQFFLELDLHGGGIDARGAVFPGVPYVLVGRGKDYAWSAMSSHSDIIDEYAETLCGDDTHYLYRRQCLAMGELDAGTIKTQGQPDQELVVRTTVHGPVQGYATVNGARVAFSQRRATRGRELASALAFSDLDANRVRSPQGFFHVMNQLEFSFNWVYADDRNIAFFSAGRLPIRAPGVDPGLPTVGTGDYEWRGFEPERRHVQGIDPRSGLILGWNNKPARDYTTGDNRWTDGSAQRVELLARALGDRRRFTLAQVVGAMNQAATQDGRLMLAWPAIAAVLRSGPAPSVQVDQEATLLQRWYDAGGSRLDRDADGKIDDPAAAILDAAWGGLADAVLRPVLGPLVDQLATLVPRGSERALDVNANSGGSAYDDGWWGYVGKDLRAVLGQQVRGPFRVRYCGGGDLAACRASLWAALQAAAGDLAAAQGPDPGAWRADAATERIIFSPGFLKSSMRWTNRPTFQQVMSFSGHRPR